MAANNALPQFSFIVPDIDDDAHSAARRSTPTTWLQANVIAPLSGIAAFQSGGDGILIVDFDESLDSDTAYGGGHVAPVLWGPHVKAGYQQASATVYQHESMLLTVMDALGSQRSSGRCAMLPRWASFSCKSRSTNIRTFVLPVSRGTRRKSLTTDGNGANYSWKR